MLSFYELAVPGYLRTLKSVCHCLDKAAEHCTATGTDPETLLDARLYEDMAPLPFQVVSVIHHSANALEGMKSGEFTPPTDKPATTFNGQKDFVLAGMERLKSLSPEDVNTLDGRDMIFRLGKNELPFTTRDFLLSFSLPNFFFHATTAYDILRAKGVPLGKRDYLGELQLRK